jgi:hypothetical protein
MDFTAGGVEGELVLGLVLILVLGVQDCGEDSGGD